MAIHQSSCSGLITIIMSISLIAAMGLDNAIGKNGQMPWHLSEDLKHFKTLTSGHTVVMGRRTWESLGGKPLPNRRNIVISKSMRPTEGCEVQSDIDFLNLYKGKKKEEIFIIGGGELYRQTIQIADTLYITETGIEIDDADTYFPKIEESHWQCSDTEEAIDAKTGIHLKFKTYKRIK